MTTAPDARCCRRLLLLSLLCCGLQAAPAARAANETPPPAGIPAAMDRADAAWSGCLRLLGGLAGTNAAQPPPVKAMTDALASLRNEVNAAQHASCLAFVKMASYTAWLVHIESRKIPASLRLIQMTRASGRTEEVERYEQRHKTLLENIDAAAHQYAVALSELIKLGPALIDDTFRQYETQLVELGLAEQIRLNQIVRTHVENYARGGEPALAQWKEELEELLAPKESGEPSPATGD